jgi:putative transposase
MRSCGAAHREVMPSAEHRAHKGLNNRAENSHQPTRRRERATKNFRSIGAAQRFLSAFSGVSPHFRPRRHLTTASGRRAGMTIRFAIRVRITATFRRPAEAWHRPGTRPHHAPPRPDMPSGTHTPDNVTAPGAGLLLLAFVPDRLREGQTSCAASRISSRHHATGW